MNHVLILMVELPIWLKIHRHGFHNFDLGIYSQALQLIEWGNFNPFLTVRNVNVFNDHFDPILLLAAPFARLWEPAFVGATVEFLMVMTSGVYAAVSLRRSGMSAVMAGAVMAFLMFNRGTISALIYPFHPTTWAILPMTMLVISMLKDRKVEIFLFLTLLFLCKEEFPFVGVMLAIGCFSSDNIDSECSSSSGRRPGSCLTMESGPGSSGREPIMPGAFSAR